MKKPVKPSTPQQPIKPQEYHTVVHNLAPFHYGRATYTFEELSSKLPSNVDPKSLKFESVYVDGNDYYGSGDYYFTIHYVCQEKNTRYVSDCKKYDKDLIKYEKKVEQHKKDLLKYEEEMVAFTAWEKEDNAKKELEELKKLEKRIAQLKKKVKS